MSQYKEIAVGGVCYFWFAANTTAGAAGDGATPLYDVRLAGASSSGAPTASGTPTLLTHANYTDGLHEIAIDTTGYAEGEYAVFSTLTISTVNPGGFVGSFVVRAAAATLRDLINAVTTTVGAAGAGLTAINLPNQTMDITGNITGNLSGSVGSVTGAAGSVTGAVGSVTAAVALTSGERNSVADALLDRAAGVETNRTLRQALRLILAGIAGKLSGAAGTTVTIRDTNDTKDRVVATVDADGNRSAVTLDAS